MASHQLAMAVWGFGNPDPILGVLRRRIKRLRERWHSGDSDHVHMQALLNAHVEREAPGTVQRESLPSAIVEDMVVLNLVRTTPDRESMCEGPIALALSALRRANIVMDDQWR
eukprot:2132589-Alexandrium_andersonii.AAC.1